MTEPMSRFHVLLRRKLDDAIADRMAELASGLPDDYAKYCKMAGHINGLAFAIRLAEEVESDLNKGG